MRFFALATAFTLIAAAATAATLEKGGDAYMQCAATLTGPIGDGDAEALKALITDLRSAMEAEQRDALGLPPSEPVYTSFGTMRLCLDSPGGSLIEAIRMGDILYSEELGTGVARDKTCQSACAILFLAGTERLTGDGYTNPNRVLHATARLGFHAPSLVVPDNQYSKTQVEKAYRIAIAGLGELSKRKRSWELSDDILNTILTTPPSDMHFVETVFDAGKWGIPVVGTYYPQEVTPLAVANACTKAYAFQVGVDPSFKPIWEYWTFSERPRYGYSPQKVETPDGAAMIMNGYGDEGAMHSCFLGLPSEAPVAFDTPFAPGSAWPYPNGTLSWGDGSARGIMPAVLYDNRLRLTEIARARDDVLEFRSVLELTARDQDRHVSGQCSVWRGQTRNDAETCSLDHLATTSSALETRSERIFTWPSGSRTTILTQYDSHGGYIEQVNGNDATRIYDWDNPPVPNGICWLNKGSGNTFCFLEDES